MAQHHVEYHPPTMGPPSPATSVGSRHPDDATSYSDSEDVISQEDFETKWAGKIGLGYPTPEEEDGNREPLLKRPQPGSAEEKVLFESVVQNLRKEINALSEDTIFQRTLLRGSVAAMHEPMLTNDIDAIMGSLMSPPSAQQHQSRSPSTWNSNVNETKYELNPALEAEYGIPDSGRRGKGKTK